MISVHYSRLTRAALTASCIALSFGSASWAQTVQVFDEAPPIEVLRKIMVPESNGAATRSIVMQRPDVVPTHTAVQRVSTQTPIAKPVPRPSAETKSGTVGFHINFAFDSAVLPSSAHSMIDTVAEVMKESPDIKVQVEGHTDAVGAAGYNLELSKRRALAVGEYLAKLGIDPSRIV
ncbi:MAG TPA: OmpA family protein, partial [Verrucomicrobiae bacterium]|nr:OmpA family protein [Verrucomicrobiae bacterium]